MTHKLKPISIAVAAAGALAAGGAAIAGAAGGHDALDKARAAALAHTPGKVTETEVGDEEGYYEVEVTRADGSQVDVHLDRHFRVLESQADARGPDDEDAGLPE
jgi:peptidase YpeB-like protein